MKIENAEHRDHDSDPAERDDGDRSRSIRFSREMRFVASAIWRRTAEAPADAFG